MVLPLDRQNEWKRHEFPLQHGVLIVMRGAVQHQFEHAVPPNSNCVHPRMNLNFRMMTKEGMNALLVYLTNHTERVWKVPNLPMHRRVTRQATTAKYGIQKHRLGVSFKNRKAAQIAGELFVILLLM